MSRTVTRHTISIEEPQSLQNELINKVDSRQFSVTPVAEAKQAPPAPVGAYSLSFFAASLHSTILEDTLSQLRYLFELNTELRIIKTKANLDLLLALKYGVEQPAVTDELHGLDPKNLMKEEYKLAKLANDRSFVCDTLLRLYTELGLTWRFTTLVECVLKARQLCEYREHLNTEDVKLNIKRKELSKQIRHQRNNIKSAYYETDSIIEDLKVQVDDLVLDVECTSRYADSWQNARLEQHMEIIQRKELPPLKSLQLYKAKLDDEQREKVEEVERWMDKYDTDMEKVDLKIQIQKNEYNVAHEQRLELEQIIKTHDELINNWVKFKEEREAARLYEEKMNQAAIVVQAWWRGLLVRKALGPYKVKGKPGGKKGKKK